MSSQLAKLRVRLRVKPLAERYRRIRRQVIELRDGWTPWKAWCFIVRTMAGAAAALLSLLDHWLSYRAHHP